MDEGRRLSLVGGDFPRLKISAGCCYRNKKREAIAKHAHTYIHKYIPACMHAYIHTCRRSCSQLARAVLVCIVCLSGLDEGLIWRTSPTHDAAAREAKVSRVSASGSGHASVLDWGNLTQPPSGDAQVVPAMDMPLASGTGGDVTQPPFW